MKKIEDMVSLGSLIRETRKSQGLTQEQLAMSCGIGIRFLREAELGKETCHIGKVLTVLRILGIDVLMAKRGWNFAGGIVDDAGNGDESGFGSSSSGEAKKIPVFLLKE